MKKRILIVEDSPTQALRAKLVLTQASFDVDSAANGLVGLEKAIANPPDLVLADINMPVMDGNQMTRQLKNNSSTSNVPILMLTGNDQPMDVILGLEAGADQFMTKPYNDALLVWRVRELFRLLEEAQHGQLPSQKQVERFSQKIVITSSREQVLQAFLSATARVINCQAMALIISSPNGERTVFSISFSPLEESLTRQMGEHLAAVLSRVLNENPVVHPTQLLPVVVEETRFSAMIDGDLQNSFMSAPLIVNGKVMGMVGVFSAIPEVFDLQHVGFLFDLGQKTADALSRIQTKE